MRFDNVRVPSDALIGENGQATSAVERQILDNLQMAVDSFDVILIADQAETSQGGVITPAVRELLARLA